MKKSLCPCRAARIFSTAFIALVASGLVAADFPQWRGPLRDGHSTETGLLQEWPKEGPKLIWQINEAGAGFSTPSVVGDRIYFLGNDGVGSESVMALAVKDGSKLWAVKLGKVGHPEQNPSYPGARSTPTVDGKLLYALGSDGDLVCLEIASGKEIWRKHLHEDFGGKYGEWAYSESPLVDGDKLIVTPGGTSATLVALNKRNGEVIWKCAAPEGDDASYASVIRAKFSGVTQYVQFLSKGLVGVDAKTGKLLWRFEKTAKGSPAVIITPLVSQGLIYSGAYRANSAVIKPQLKDGKFVLEEIYSGNKLPIGLGGVVKVGDYFYGSSSQSAMCVEFKTGVIKWEERAIGPCSWLAADGRIYVHAESGVVALIETTPEAYREKGRFSPANPPQRGEAKAWAYPVIANGRLYIRELNSLWCYDIKAGK
ncbi:MAG: PQQ-binding-like beta-propeller repeat protein [Verrucomicrobiota bacterium]